VIDKSADNARRAAQLVGDLVAKAARLRTSPQGSRGTLLVSRRTAPAHADTRLVRPACGACRRIVKNTRAFGVLNRACTRSAQVLELPILTITLIKSGKAVTA
jgi:hypothetical protein